MSLTIKKAFLDGGIAPENIYINSNIDKYMSKDGNNSLERFLNRVETVTESPLVRQETYYEDSTIRDKSSDSAGVLVNLDTIEDEEFDIEEITEKGFNYAPKTLLEAVDTMLIILEDLGNRYSKWKHGHNGIHRFYCHKYNLTNIEVSRPYYRKILNQLNNIDSISLHLLSTHYKAKSDSAVYSSNDLVDNILCQLDELVSCYCSKKCAFGISNEVCHVCSDISVNHTNLKWKYPTTTERFLALAKTNTTDRSVLSEKNKSMERNPSLEWSRPMSRTLSLDQNILHRPISTESANEVETQSEKPKLEEVLEKLDSALKDSNQNLGESCFIREMGDYNSCVMQYFSERGIMHNFSQPYVKGEEAVPLHSFLRAVVCYNCGKFCRCRCQRKIFRKYTTEESPEHSQSRETSEADFLPHLDCHLDLFERRSKEFINEIYTKYRGKNRSNEWSKQSINKENVPTFQDLRSIYTHSLKSTCGRIQFLTSSSESPSSTTRDVEEPGVEDTKKKSNQINTNITKGSKIDVTMGSVYYSNLFRGNVSKVSSKEIFEIINTVPFSCVPVDLFNAYKKAEWYEMYTSVWWRLDTRFEEAQLLEEDGNLEPYILNVLDALGYLGNIRYDSNFKVIGVGYYRKKNCYWRYFYVKDTWESFRCAVEYFILISTLPSEVHIDHKLLCFVATRNGVQKKFSFHPSVLNAYTHMVAYVNGNDYGRTSRSRSYSTERRFYIKNPCGVDYFDPEKVGTQKCTVADVVEVSIKRKLISLPDATAPRRHYTQKAATATPTIKLKLDPQLIYQGIFVSTPNGSSNNTIVTNGSNQNLYSGLSGNGTNVRVDITPNNSYVSSCKAMLPNQLTPNRNDSYNCTEYNSVNSTGAIDSDTTIDGMHCSDNINRNTISKACLDTKEGMSVDNLFDLKLNNLNIILSYYPDVCTQYNTIIKQANDLRMQLSLLLSDLKCIVFDPLQNGIDVCPNSVNSRNGDSSGLKHESVDSAKGSVESKDIVDVVKKKSEAAGAKKNKLPMSDVCYNSATNSWVCFLEVMPCLVCPLECDRSGSCVYYTQGKRLIELLCSKVKPTSVQYAFHPHFCPNSHQNHQDKKLEVGVVSFSVNQFGQERARLLASQLKATYKIQALNTMLYGVSKDKNGNEGDTKKSNENGIFPNSVEMKILHNAITAHLTTLMSIHSYIIYDDDEYDSLESKNFSRMDIDKNLRVYLKKNRESNDSMKKAFTKGYKLKTSEQLNELIKDKVNELNNCKMAENGGLNYSEIIDTIHSNAQLNWLKNGVLNHDCELDDHHTNVSNNGKENDTTIANKSNNVVINIDRKEDINGQNGNTENENGDNHNHFDTTDDSVDLEENCYESSYSTEDSYRECFCYYHGSHLRGNQGDLEVSNVVRFNENLYTFSNIFEMSRLIQLNSRKLQYCSRHCCFVTVWKDAMDQTRVMFHSIGKFIPFRSFDAYVNKFKRDWPEAVRIHNLHSRSRDTAEGSKMVAKVNAILCECFGNLLSLQKIINDAVVSSMTLAIRALSDASQEKNLLTRLFLINEHFRVSKDAMRNAMIFSNEILFPFGALHDEATPPISDDDF